jgi:predicted unusual protein kinase regulating ubiquinone biosynthesis (AarF/ABC1/UbiB family)
VYSSLHPATSAQRIGLIDYGQVKKLSDDVRTSFARLIIALSRDDRSEVVRIMQQVSDFYESSMSYSATHALYN